MKNAELVKKLNSAIIIGHGIKGHQSLGGTKLKIEATSYNEDDGHMVIIGQFNDFSRATVQIGSTVVGVHNVLGAPTLNYKEDYKEDWSWSGAVIGNRNLVRGDALTFGVKNIGYSTTGVAFGYKNLLYNDESVSFGANNFVHAPGATVLGIDSGAHGWRGLAAGRSAWAEGCQSVSLGSDTQAELDGSVVLGVESRTLEGRDPLAGQLAYDPSGRLTGNLNAAEVAKELDPKNADAQRYQKILASAEYKAFVDADTALLASEKNYHKLKGEFNKAAADYIENVSLKDGKKAEALKTKMTDLAAKVKEAKTDFDAKSAAQKAARDVTVDGVRVGTLGRDGGMSKVRSAASAWVSSHAPLSVGSTNKGYTRQIINVAGGTRDTDAVNVAQLKQAVLLTKNLQKATGLSDEEIGKIADGGAHAPKTLVDRIVEAGKTGAPDPTKYAGAQGSGLTATKTGDTVTYNLDLSKNDQFKDLKNLVNRANANATAGWNVTVGDDSATINAKQGMIFGNSDDNIELLLKAGAQGKAHQLDMKLADDLKVKNSVNVGGKEGMTLTKDALNVGGKDGSTVTKDGLNIGGKDGTTISKDGVALGDKGPKVTKDGLDMKGTPITNVGESDDPNSVVTLRQVQTLVEGAKPQTQSVTPEQLQAVKGQLSGADAANAALGALQPLDYDELRPTTFSFGMGFSGGSSAVALGLTHYFNADKAFNVGASLSGDTLNWRLGASWRLGQADERAVQTGDSLKTMQTKLNKALQDLEAERTARKALEDRLTVLEEQMKK